MTSGIHKSNGVNDSPNPWLFRTGLGLAILIPLMSLPMPFFWDSILLGSEVGQHFFNNGLGAWILPTELDSGHPPGFGWYLAVWWKFLGLSLPVAHLAMMPVLILIWLGFYRILILFMPGKSNFMAHGLAALLLLMEPTFIAQAIHIGPDLMLLALYLWAVISIIEHRNWLLTALLFAMGMVSLRGCFSVAALWFTHLGWLFIQEKESKTAGQLSGSEKGLSIRSFLTSATLLPYAIATAGIMGWFAWHAHQTGWFLVNSASSWSSSQQFPGVIGMARNLGLIVWRMLDFGRLVLWIPGLFWFVSWLVKANKNSQESGMIMIFIVPLFILSLAFLPFSNPIAHRYYLIVFVLAIPWFAYRIQLLEGTRQRFFIIAAIGMLGFGHRWIYPDKVAQGWDASLAHLPFFSLMSEAWSEIPNPDLVYTEFPLYKPMQSIRPGSHQERLSFRKAEGDWLQYDYILYSNIINDIDGTTYDQITTTWPMQKEWEQGKIFIRLYRKPGIAPIELKEKESE